MSDTSGPSRHLPSYPFVFLLAAASGGIVIDRCGEYSAVAWWIGGCSCLLVWRNLRRATKKSRAGAWLLLLSTALLFASWHHRQWQLFAVDELGRAAPADEFGRLPVCVRGEVLDRPRCLPTEPTSSSSSSKAAPATDRTRFQLRVNRLWCVGGWRAASGVTQVTVEGAPPDIRLGDEVQVWALLERVRGPANPGQVDWRRYFRSQRQLCVLRAGHPACVKLLRPATAHPRYWLGRLRAQGESVLAEHLDPRRHGLAVAILLGTQGTLTRQQTEAFFRTGTVHVLSISGLHVGILAWALLAAARAHWLPRGVALAGVALLVGGYAALTEGHAPVVRAAVLVHVVCLSWWTHRRPAAFNSLAAAAIVVLARNPTDLFQTGAQLSFVAVATLAGLGPHLIVRPPTDPLERLVWRTRRWPWRAARWLAQHLAQMIAASLGVWLVTLPLIQHQFHLVSPVAVLMNVLLWGPVALALFSGFGVLLCHALCPPAAHLCAVCCDLNLAVLQAGVERAAHWPAAYAWIPSPGPVWTLGYYLVIGPLLTLRSRRSVCWGWATTATAWALVTAVCLHGSGIAPPTQLRATFLSVGHGTCVLLEMPAGYNLLYDCGRRGPPESATDSVARYLWWRRIRHIDAIVLSHADADHYNLLHGLLERFRVGCVYVPPDLWDQPSLSLAAVRQDILSHGVPMREVRMRDELPAPPGCRLRVLHPSGESLHTATDNAQSLVLTVHCNSSTLLLPGDLEKQGLDRLLQQPPPAADLIMAPHHGTPTSEPQRLLAWSPAPWMVVSGQDARDLRRLRSRLACAGVGLWHTAHHGAVFVTVSNGRLRVDSFLHPIDRYASAKRYDRCP